MERLEVPRSLQKTSVLPERRPPVRRRRTILWALALLVMLGAGGGLSLYAHLGTPLEEAAAGNAWITIGPPPVVIRVAVKPANISEEELHIRAMLRFDHPADAQRLALECLHNDPRQARCHMFLGTAAARLGDPARAVEEYEKFLDLAPTDPSEPKIRGLINGYRAAADKSQLVVPKDPEDDLPIKLKWLPRD